ncbi:glycosyltransferase family 2 protein [Weissella confusa]|uniref:glycosyltransferase family 2 protein n=1 Tax=Weissella confusa TaxID=1583 RepID=UPI00223C4C8B|nr:glycosyltransferase family 2 protein [Weissella confusa]MCS9990601.1 glycosyltransferase [Weissella confusa]
MAESTQLLSIVVPVWNEDDVIDTFISHVESVHAEHFEHFAVEYWFVDDGSTDNTLKVLKSWHKQKSAVHYISFSKNFGKEAAMYAGLKRASGDFVAIMDVDLQDPPELLPEMLAGVVSGEWDAVGSRRVAREGEPKIRSFFSRLFYKLINMISDTKIVDGARDFRVMSRKMVDSLTEMTEYNRFSKGLFAWVGFKQKYIPYENVHRVAGKTHWSFWNLLKYSVSGIVAFSQVPLALVSFLGMISFLASFIGGAAIIIRKLLVTSSSVDGWPSLVVIILFVGGIQLLSLGIVGRYVSSIYLEVKRRPIFIAREEE